MVSIHVFWSALQPLPDKEIDWTFPDGRGAACQGRDPPSWCGWSWADAVRAAAQRGMFVHARIGPYACAEYSYGGKPEWVPLHTNMQMRRFDKQWLKKMEAYVASTIQYLTQHKLFAYQGGPVFLGQIENELLDNKK